MSENARRFLRFRAAAPVDNEGKPIRKDAVVLIRTGEFEGYYGIVADWVNKQVVVDIPGLHDNEPYLYQTETYESTDLGMRS